MIMLSTCKVIAKFSIVPFAHGEQGNLQFRDLDFISNFKTQKLASAEDNCRVLSIVDPMRNSSNFKFNFFN